MAPEFGTSGLRGLVSELSDALVGDYTRAFLAAAAPLAPLMTRDCLLPMVAPLAAARAAGQRIAPCAPGIMVPAPNHMTAA